VLAWSSIQQSVALLLCRNSSAFCYQSELWRAGRGRRCSRGSDCETGSNLSKR